jgi:serine/threonine protein kinase
MIDLHKFAFEVIEGEIAVMAELQHPNIVPMYCSFLHQSKLWLVMPFFSGGSCCKILSGSGTDAEETKGRFYKGFKSDALLATILKSVLEALVYMHQSNRIHRDVKGANVLISETGEVKLGDFGVARSVLNHGYRTGAQTFIGTPCWMAPEVMQQLKPEGEEDEYDAKADIWSFGMLALELAYGRAPYYNLPSLKILTKTITEPPPTCDIYGDSSYEFAKSFKSLIKKCLNKNVEKRSTAAALLEHKFFRHAQDAQFLVNYFDRGELKAPEMKADAPVLDFSDTKAVAADEDNCPIDINLDIPISYSTQDLFREIQNAMKIAAERDEKNMTEATE